MTMLLKVLILFYLVFEAIEEGLNERKRFKNAKRTRKNKTIKSDNKD